MLGVELNVVLDGTVAARPAHAVHRLGAAHRGRPPRHRGYAEPSATRASSRHGRLRRGSRRPEGRDPMVQHLTESGPSSKDRAFGSARRGRRSAVLRTSPRVRRHLSRVSGRTDAEAVTDDGDEPAGGRCAPPLAEPCHRPGRRAVEEDGCPEPRSATDRPRAARVADPGRRSGGSARDGTVAAGGGRLRGRRAGSCPRSAQPPVARPRRWRPDRADEGAPRGGGGARPPSRSADLALRVGDHEPSATAS